MSPAKSFHPKPSSIPTSEPPLYIRTPHNDRCTPPRTILVAARCEEDPGMELHVDIVTLAVPDLEAAHRFYVDGLGWEPALAVPGEVTFLRAGSGRMIALFRRADLAADIGSGEPPPFDLGHLCDDEAGVDAVSAALVEAGGTVRNAAP